MSFDQSVFTTGKKRLHSQLESIDRALYGNPPPYQRSDKNPKTDMIKLPIYSKIRPKKYGKRTSSFSKRRSIKTLEDKVRKLWQDAIVERPPKHILFSDSGVTGGNASAFSTTALVNSGPQIMLCNFLSRGTTVQSRLADYAYISKVYFKFLTNWGTAVTGTQYINWMLFVQKEPKGTALTAAQFGADYFGINSPQSQNIPNRNNKDVQKYRILKQGRIQNNELVNAVQERTVWTVSWFAKDAIRVSYTLGNAGTIADIDTNAIYLYMYTDNVNGAGATGIQSFIEGNVYFRDQV